MQQFHLAGTDARCVLQFIGNSLLKFRLREDARAVRPYLLSVKKIRAGPRDSPEINNQLPLCETFYADYFVYQNNCRTFASPEPPSLLTMLKSGVVFFI